MASLESRLITLEGAIRNTAVVRVTAEMFQAGLLQLGFEAPPVRVGETTSDYLHRVPEETVHHFCRRVWYGNA